MRLKYLTLVAAMFLVAACTTASEELADTGGEGAATTTSNDGVTTGPATTAADDDEAMGEEATEEEETQVAARTPPGIQPGSQQDLIITVGDRVFFDFDKFNIRPDARTVLSAQAAWMNRNQEVSISIEGHADQRGTREYNLALGERRATTVKNFLVALGVLESRITIISFGKERPVALGSNETAWAQNRRGVTVVD